MPLNIVSDYNGTIVENSDEGKVWEYVGLGSLSLAHPIRSIKLAMAVPGLKSLTKIYKSGEIGYDKIYEAYNEKVLSQLPLTFVQSLIDRYALEDETNNSIDYGLLKVIDTAHEQGSRTGILSTGCKYGIERVLKMARHLNTFDRIVANELFEKDSGSELRLEIFGNKDRFLEEVFFKELRFDPRNTAYIGDNKDEEPCMEYMVSNGGKVVIPLLASDAFKQHCATKYKAMVPETKEDVARQLGVKIPE